MKRTGSIYFLVALVALSIPTGGRAASMLVARVALSDLFPMLPGIVENCTPVFLSDNTVAVLARTKAVRGDHYLPSNVVVGVLHLGQGTITLATSFSMPADREEVQAIGTTHLLIRGRRRATVYSSDLKTATELLVRPTISSTAGSKMVAINEDGNWRVNQIIPHESKVTGGTGTIRAVSDQVAMVSQSGRLRSTALDGHLLGEFAFSAEGNVIEIASAGQLFLNEHDHPRLVDFTGRTQFRISPPQGWGFRHSWSADGSRMLFNNFTRTIDAQQKESEWVGRVLTFGLGAPNEDSNGELIRVISPSDGRACFSLDSPGILFGVPGELHADISRSGRLVVIATRKDILLYRLPATCDE